MATMRALPQRDGALWDAADFILDSPLGRKAQQTADQPGVGVFLRDTIAEIYRLQLSCHLAEFTDHGLPHGLA
ncbi:MAG: hypothetical protein GF320_09595 [Armatimonadia bacterium]|nr:hypothetical protein [Armatimonadia bacterium]